MNGTASHEAQSPPNMVWIPGGTFRMGSADFYPEERPVHDVTVDGFWMDRLRGHQRASSRDSSEETGYVTVAERAPSAGGLPRRPAGESRSRFDGLPEASGPVDLRNYANWWAWVPGASWRHPRGPASSLDGLGRHPVVHVALRRRRGLRTLGGQGPADRSGVGVRGARRSRRRHVHLGRRGIPGRQGHGERLAGRVPVAEPAHRRSRRDVSGRLVSAKRLRPLRHGRQRLGVDERLVRAARREPDGEVLLHGARSTRAMASAEKSYDPRQPQFRIPRKVVKGGSHLCAPNYCFRYRPAAQAAADDRHRHGPHRVPLHRSSTVTFAEIVTLL